MRTPSARDGLQQPRQRGIRVNWAHAWRRANGSGLFSGWRTLAGPHGILVGEEPRQARTITWLRSRVNKTQPVGLTHGRSAALGHRRAHGRVPYLWLPTPPADRYIGLCSRLWRPGCREGPAAAAEGRPDGHQLALPILDFNAQVSALLRRLGLPRASPLLSEPAPCTRIRYSAICPTTLTKSLAFSSNPIPEGWEDRGGRTSQACSA